MLRMNCIAEEEEQRQQYHISHIKGFYLRGSRQQVQITFFHITMDLEKKIFSSSSLVLASNLEVHLVCKNLIQSLPVVRLADDSENHVAADSQCCIWK